MNVYPYCKIVVGGMCARTMKSSGLNPKWNERFSFEAEDSAFVQMVVCDEHPQLGEIEVHCSQWSHI